MGCRPVYPPAARRVHCGSRERLHVFPFLRTEPIRQHGRVFSLAGGNFGGILLGVPCERHVNRVAA